MKMLETRDLCGLVANSFESCSVATGMCAWVNGRDMTTGVLLGRKPATGYFQVLVAGSWQLSSAAYDDKHNPSSLMAFVP